ncbi:hypothetical protein [Aequorivita marina]|uniref:hypothetical protein n=1 Tax=Aequorivita marina TaxID=3073654 RepID=UPI002876CE03|nr:hypothetical protein [Aequorivita sp. S2608]MDS1297273.1 hypothetical protein [Aequorivita sp. S2608]
MKKLILSTAIVLGGLTAVTAQTDKEAIAMNEQTETAAEVQAETKLEVASEAVQDYKEVKSAELPKAVRDAVAKDFPGASIAKAYVNAQGDYKIDLATADAKQATVYANAKGEWIKNEIKKQ